MNVCALGMPALVHAPTVGSMLHNGFTYTRCGKSLWVDKWWTSALNGELTEADVSCMACIAATAAP